MERVSSLLKARLLLPKLYFVLVTFYVLICLLFLAFKLMRGMWWVDLLVNFTPFVFVPLVVLWPLAFVAQSYRAVILLLIPTCLAVVWFSPYFTAKTKASADNSLRILTFNAHTENTRTADFVGWLEHLRPDIILLQEVPQNWEVLDVSQKLLADYPYQVAQYHQAGIGDKIMLSRLPIAAASHFQLGDFDRLWQQRTVIETSNGQIAVYNIHLMPNYGDFPRFRVPFYHPAFRIALSYDETLRSIQVNELLTTLQNEPLPYILGGDFNTSEYSRLYDLLHASLSDSFREAGSGFGMTWRYAPAGLGALMPLLRIDYIWHDAHFAALRSWIEPSQGSDHLPLVSEIAFIGMG